MSRGHPELLADLVEETAQKGCPPDKEGLNWDGSWIGLMATSSRDKTEMLRPEDRQTANIFGMRIANAARRWNNLSVD